MRGVLRETPDARDSDGLLIRSLGEESVVLAPGQRGALALDKERAAVLALCDGRTPRKDAERSLAADRGLPAERACERLEEHLDWLRKQGVLASEHMPTRNSRLIVSEPLGGELD